MLLRGAPAIINGNTLTGVGGGIYNYTMTYNNNGFLTSGEMRFEALGSTITFTFTLVSGGDGGVISFGYAFFLIIPIGIAFIILRTCKKLRY